MSNGQSVVTRIENFFTQYMVFPDPAYALVAALWVFHTWFSVENFDSTPYLHIRGPRGSGKTRFAELLALLSRNSVLGDSRPAAIYRALDALDNKLTLFIDEAENLSSGAASFMRKLMNKGYRKGQTEMVTMPGGKVKFFKVYCPKAFMSIGDLTDTIRSRSIVLSMERGKPGRDYMIAEAESQAAAILHAMQHDKPLAHMPTEVFPSHLRNARDREIWGALYGMAYALGLDKPTLARLDAISADLASQKTADAQYFAELENVNDGDTVINEYREEALRDLAAVIGPEERAIFSVLAVERMKAIPTGPWRKFKGAGLTELLLARMVAPFGVVTNMPVRMDRGRTAKKLKGYSAANVRDSFSKLQGGVQ